MNPDGELEVEKSSTGKYRWIYTTPAGAMYLGPKLYTRKADAQRAGQIWLRAETQGSKTQGVATS